MKGTKKIMFLLISLCVISNAKAQLIEQGNVIITPYLGAPNFGNALGKVVERKVDYFKIDNGKGPYGGRVEYFVHNKISVGVDFIYNEVNGSGYVDSTLVDLTKERYTIDVTSKRYRFLIRSNFHFYNNEKIDFYTGAGIGLNIRDVKVVTNIPYLDDKSIKGSLVPVAGRFALGTTYYPIDFLGINLELGVGGPMVSGGLSFKF